MFGPKTAGKKLMQQVFRIVLIHLDFFEHYLAFFTNVIGVKPGA